MPAEPKKIALRNPPKWVKPQTPVLPEPGLSFSSSGTLRGGVEFDPVHPYVPALSPKNCARGAL
jgi:hypothetical protein